jgi:undecaprenyl-diphosphatase
MSAARPLACVPPSLGPGSALKTCPQPRTSGAHGWDKTWFLDVNNFARHTKWLHFFMHHYARDGVWLLPVLVVLGWWLARRGSAVKVAAALWTGVGTLAALAIAEPVRSAVAEARPWQSIPHILNLTDRTHQFAFPSGNGVITGAVVAGMLLYHRKLAVPTAVLGLLNCFAWVYIGGHYPQDILGGLALGAVVSLVGWALVRVPLTAGVRWLRSTPLRLLAAAQSPDPAQLPPSRVPPSHPERLHDDSPADSSATGPAGHLQGR